MNRPFVLAVLACALLPSACLKAAHSETVRLPLYKISSAERYDLKCTSAEYGLSLPVPQRWKVEKASLSFRYVNSTALLAANSRLIVKFNGEAVAQRNLNPLAPEGTMKVDLPPSLFKPGYNNLDFIAHQHYSTNCEFPCQPELWTTLKLGDEDAVLEIEYAPERVPLRLSAITNFLFDPKLTPRGEIVIVMPDSSAETIGIAGIIASGVAMRFDYRNVVFSVSREIVPGYDNILIGDADFTGRMIRGSSDFDAKAGIRGPFLKIMPLPVRQAGKDLRDPYHALVVVSGLNKDHMKLAAETFAIMSAPFPETDEMTVTGIKMPDIPLYGGREVIKADKTYTFKSLNFTSRTFKGINSSRAELSFRLPPDFLIKQNRYAELSLSYAYGAALRSDSVLNLSLNGQLLRGIHLNEEKGALIEGYMLDIPTYLFKPGNNVLRLEPVLTPSVGKICDYFQTENLFLTVMDVSTIRFPPMPHYVDMPRLELFMLNGFPVTRWPDGHGAKVYLTNTGREGIETALNLLGTITQKNGHPLLEIQFITQPPQKYAGELMIIGDVGSLPAGIREMAPLALTKEISFPYPVVQGWADESQFAFSRQVSGLSANTGAVMEFQSPYGEGHSVVLLTARSLKEVRALSLALMKYGVQANLKGDLVLIDLNDPEKNVIAVSVGKKYFAGKAGPISRLDARLYAHPWLYYALLALVVIALSLALFYFLNKYRKKRITGA